MSGLIYPGIWGVLQPVRPRQTYQTSLLFPFLVSDSLNLPQPQITSDSLMRATFFTFSFTDSMGARKGVLTAGCSLDTVIAYKSYSFADSMAARKGVLTAGCSLDTVIAYKSTTFGDTLNWAKPLFHPESSMVVVINYVNTSAADNLPFRKPMFTASSTMFNE